MQSLVANCLVNTIGMAGPAAVSFIAWYEHMCCVIEWKKKQKKQQCHWSSRRHQVFTCPMSPSIRHFQGHSFFQPLCKHDEGHVHVYRGLRTAFCKFALILSVGLQTQGEVWLQQDPRHLWLYQVWHPPQSVSGVLCLRWSFWYKACVAHFHCCLFWQVNNVTVCVCTCHEKTIPACTGVLISTVEYYFFYLHWLDFFDLWIFLPSTFSHLGLKNTHELFEAASHLANIVIPQVREKKGFNMTLCYCVDTRKAIDVSKHFPRVRLFWKKELVR